MFAGADDYRHCSGAHPREAQEMVFDAHDRAFTLFAAFHVRSVSRRTGD
jgi:hypothetical protein